MKEPYVFDLIELTVDYKERELENKMLEKLKNKKSNSQKMRITNLDIC